MGGRAREGKGEGEEEAMVVRERVEEETSESIISTTKSQNCGRRTV